MAGMKKDKRSVRDRSQNNQEDNNPPRPSTQHAGGGSGNAADVTPPLGVGPSGTPPLPRRLNPSKRYRGAGSLSSDKDKRQKTKVGESSSASGLMETASTGQFICPHPTCGRVFTRRQGVNGHMHYHNKVRIEGRDDGVAAEGANDVSPREQAKQRMIAAANQLLSKLTKDDNLPKHGAAATFGGGATSSSSDPASRRIVPTRTHLEFDIYRRPRDGTFTSARLRLELDFDVDPPLDDPEPEPGFDMNEDPPLDPESGFNVNEESPPES